MFVKVSILGALCLFGVAFGAPIEGQVVNGTDAKEGEIPYIVSLRSYHNHNCGGTILDANHIMTAAHCAQYANPASLSIQYGVTAITAGADAPNLIQVESLVVNPDFIPGSGYYNDVAVLRLAEPLVFGPNVQPIQLPRAFNATPENCQATLSGWGLPFSGGAVMENLQKAVITVYTDDDCERIHEQTGPTNRNYNICAGIPEGGKGQCNGDSGGPLVCDGVQVGIVSWSVKPCTVKGYPGVFTKVSAEIPFVDQQLLN